MRRITMMVAVLWAACWAGQVAAADPIRTAIGIETGLLREWLAR